MGVIKGTKAALAKGMPESDEAVGRGTDSERVRWCGMEWQEKLRYTLSTKSMLSEATERRVMTAAAKEWETGMARVRTYADAGECRLRGKLTQATANEWVVTQSQPHRCRRITCDRVLPLLVPDTLTAVWYLDTHNFIAQRWLCVVGFF